MRFEIIDGKRTKVFEVDCDTMDMVFKFKTNEDIIIMDETWTKMTGVFGETIIRCHIEYRKK